MKAQSPIDQQWYYFIDKCLPFGSSISCALFQEFSNAVVHIVRFKTKKDLVNYLDDYLFAALTKMICNGQIRIFLKVCELINFPVSMEKTEWGTCCLTFLGLLIDTINRLVCVPTDKIGKAKELIQMALERRKIKVRDIQKLCGFLNFLSKAIVPGRTFTRRIYSLMQGKCGALKQHHHTKLSQEVKYDLQLWLKFLDHPAAVCRPFADFRLDNATNFSDVRFFMDASKNSKLGCGGWCKNEWFQFRWPEQFLKDVDPSIAYLEMYGVAIGILLWIKHFANSRIFIHCDNQSVVHMINNTSSNCPNCMVLI